LFNLDAREGWSLMEDELDTYMEEHSQHMQDDGEGPKIILSSPPTPQSSHTRNLIMIMGLLFLLHESLISIMLMMIHQPGVIIRVGIDLHLGQKPKLGGRYTDISLIYTSYSLGTLYIHVSFSFFFFFFVVLVLFLLS
jgi:hypothetical protein